MMQRKRSFIPFSQIKEHENAVVVDSHFPNRLTLSHWPGAPKLKQLHDDTSAGIVLNVLKHKSEILEGCRYVTNNHFDIDGFLGIWCLIHPEKGLDYDQLFRKMALLGDFREIQLKTAEDHKALQLVCWFNGLENQRFYAPFDNREVGANELHACVPKYDYFLEAFEEVIREPQRGKEFWEEEYEAVIKGMEILQSNKSRQWNEDNIRLHVVETPEPLHYYALYSNSQQADMVLCMYEDNRYELEYKYTSWVDTATRQGYPRIELDMLADRLNKIEGSGMPWRSEKITDTAPILRLGGQELNKVQRYASPTLRPIHSSDINPADLLQEVRQFYQQAYQGIEPKTNWSWPEVRELNKQIRQTIC